MPAIRKTTKRKLKDISDDPVPTKEPLTESKQTVEYNTRTGRPIRKSAGLKQFEPTFVNPDDAISDGDEDADVFVEDFEDNVCLAKKRKRSPSPPTTPRRLIDDGDLMDDDDDHFTPPPARISSPTFQPVSLTFNVPQGHSGPFIVNLDINSLLHASQSPVSKSTLRRQPCTPSTDSGYDSKSRGASELSLSQVKDEHLSSPIDPTKPGFLKLSGELRNKIYRLLFVTDEKLDFGQPRNFARSSHFLATCKQVHEEGRSILYSENTFFFQPCRESRSRRFESGTYQIGYKDVRFFLKAMGTHNVELIRHIILLFEDLAQSLNPQKKNADDRRFTNDDDLRAALRILGDHGRLQTLKMSFQGRRLFFFRDDERFSSYLERIRADSVEFVDRPGYSYGAASRLTKHAEKQLKDEMQRQKPLFATTPKKG